jgi:hypothetical protein
MLWDEYIELARQSPSQVFIPQRRRPTQPQREFPRDRFTRDFKNRIDWEVCSVEFEIDDSLHPTLQKMMGGASPARCTRPTASSPPWQAG